MCRGESTIIEANNFNLLYHIMSSTPPAKRYRTDTDDDNTNTSTVTAATNSTNNSKDNNTANNSSLDVISTLKILQQITTLSNDYSIATPFPHGIINNFCTDGLLGEFVCCLYVLHIILRLSSIKVLQSTNNHTYSLLFMHMVYHTHDIHREDINRIET